MPVDLGATVGNLVRGRCDPTGCRRGDELWWATNTPLGAATLHVALHPREGLVRSCAWGDGAAWVIDQVPHLLGPGNAYHVFGS